MKRFIAVFLVLVLCAMGAACAETIDYTSMSDQQLNEMINGARLELAKRGEFFSTDLKLFEADGISLYLTGDYEIIEDFMSLDARVINESDKKVSISVDPICINGVEVMGTGIYDVLPERQAADMIFVELGDAGFTEYAQIEDIEFYFEIYDADTYDTYNTLDGLKVYFGEEGMRLDGAEVTAEEADAAEEAAESASETAVSDETVQHMESSTGIYSLDVPVDYVVIDEKLFTMMIENVGDDELSKTAEMMGMDLEYVAEQMAVLSQYEFSEDDMFVIAPDLVGNLNVIKSEEFPLPISKDMLQYAGLVLDIALRDSLGDSFELKGVQQIGETWFYCVSSEASGQNQYLTLAENGDMLMFTFTRMDENVEQAILESVRVN